MPCLIRTTLLWLVLVILTCSVSEVAANPLGDFFRKVGRTLSKPNTSSPATKKPRDETRSAKEAVKGQEDTSTPAPSVTPTSPATLSPTATPVPIRAATTAPRAGGGARDVPFGVAVPDRPGLVTSPYAPNEGLVDVTAFPSSTEVVDPFTGKIFLTP